MSFKWLLFNIRWLWWVVSICFRCRGTQVADCPWGRPCGWGIFMARSMFSQSSWFHGWMVLHAREALLPCVFHQLVLVQQVNLLWNSSPKICKCGSLCSINSSLYGTFLWILASLITFWTAPILSWPSHMVTPKKEYNSTCGQPVWVPQGTESEAPTRIRDTNEVQDWVNILAGPVMLLAWVKLVADQQPNCFSNEQFLTQPPTPTRAPSHAAQLIFWILAPHFN